MIIILQEPNEGLHVYAPGLFQDVVYVDSEEQISVMKTQSPDSIRSQTLLTILEDLTKYGKETEHGKESEDQPE